MNSRDVPSFEETRYCLKLSQANPSGHFDSTELRVTVFFSTVEKRAPETVINSLDGIFSGETELIYGDFSPTTTTVLVVFGVGIVKYIGLL